MEIKLVRILEVYCPDHLIGGSKIHTQEIAQDVNKYLNNQIIISRYCTDSCTDKISGIRIIRIRARKFHTLELFDNMFFMMKVFFTINKLKKEGLVNVIMTHHLTETFFGIIIGFILRLPVVSTIHGTLSAYSNRDALAEKIYAKLLKPRYALIIQDGSQAFKNFSIYWGKKVIPIRHFVDPLKYFKIERNLELIKKYGLSLSDYIIISNSSLIPNKNIEIAINIFSIFNKDKRNCYLLIPGDGPLKSDLVNLCKKLNIDDKVIFLGNINPDYMNEIYNLGNIWIGTSLHSNRGRSLYEAMACQIPSVIFDDESEDSLLIDGYNVFLIQRNDEQKFVEKLNILYNDENLRKLLGINSRKTVLENLTQKNRISIELDVLKMAINSK